jgi:hypothetical protein
MIFTSSLLIPYWIIAVEHTRARLITTTEVRGFVDSYSSTPEWALSAISVSLFSLTIGSDQGVYVDAAIILAFIFPAAYYLNKNFPFGLWATIYEAELTPENGIYNVSLSVTTGSNIDDYLLEIDLPDGAEIQGFQSPDEKHRLSDKERISGKAPIDKDDFVIGLTIKETSGIGYDNILQIFDVESDRLLTTVELKRS